MGISALFFISSCLTRCIAYVLPREYEEQQLRLLNQLLEGTPYEPEYTDDPIDVVEVQPTDEEVVEALLKQLENPAQSEAIYEELMKSRQQEKIDESAKIEHQLEELAHPETASRKSLKILPLRKKRSIPPFVQEENPKISRIRH